MKKVFVHLKDYKKECIIGPLFKLLEASFELFIPLVVASIVDIGIRTKDITYILQMVGILILLGLVGLACSLTAQYFAAKAATGFGTKLRHHTLKHIQSFSYKEIDKLGTATLITRMSSDINLVQTGVNLVIRLLLRSPFVVIGAMVMAFYVNFDAGIIFAIVIPILCILVFGIMAITMPMYKKVQSNLDNVTRTSRENLNGVRVIRAFCREYSQIDEFNEQTERLNKAQNFVAKIASVMSPVTFVVVNVAVISLMWTGAIKVENDILSQGQVLALYNYMSQILVELVKTADLIVSMTKSMAGASRIQSVLEISPSQIDGTQSIKNIETIEFKNVSFKYNADGDDAISNISFKAKKGQTIGIVGGTGSGKSTLVNLIPRFYDCGIGEILVNGKNINDYKQDDLREKISVVPQKAVLFAGNIRENMRWGKADASDEEIFKALEISQALDVVQSKNGLETVVSQAGKNFSGGQKQRLSIARAIIKNPDILILDDSSSALDYMTDLKLRKSIQNLENIPLCFNISQRASSVKNADLILVMDDGELVASGSHDDLIENCEVYQEIYYSQFSKEEMA